MSCNPCTTCGSSAPCGCRSSSVGSTCNCGNPVCSGGCNSNQCCSPSLPATPLPFYACAPVCKEDHMQRVFIQQFKADVKIEGSWNTPDCGDSAIVFATALKSIVVGSYLWNPNYGYFEITAFDVTRGLLTLVNHCNDGNAAAGTNVPACSDFTVTDPPVVIPNSNVCLLLDFTAPDVDACIDITLTSTTGIAIGDTVQIGSGFYFVQAVKPNNIITICNNGDGITPGTPVIAIAPDGSYNYCLGVIAQNPCDVDGTISGAIIVCDGLQQKKLHGNIPSDPSSHWMVVPILTDTTTDAAQYAALGVSPVSCSTITFPLNIVSGTDNYTIDVVDPTQYSITEYVSIEGYPDDFQITNIVGNTLSLTAVITPTTTVTIAVGKAICAVNCCDFIQNYLTSIVDGRETANDAGTNEINEVTTEYTTAHTTFTVTNPSPIRPIDVLHNWQCILAGAGANEIGPAFVTVTLRMHFIINGDPEVTRDFTFTLNIFDEFQSYIQDAEINYNWIDTIAAGDSSTYEIWSSILYIDGPGSAYTSTFLGFNANYLGHTN